MRHRAAISYLNNSGSKTKAARIFNVSRETLYHWLKVENLRTQIHQERTYKIDKATFC
ncbi:IS630 transposase-related protein [Nitrosococcus oceani]|uniref:IS630 transposase-related protein n=1 Tax=Nitrosococcus oceani TaxID=1229 RepID=UPI0009DE089A